MADNGNHTHTVQEATFMAEYGCSDQSEMTPGGKPNNGAQRSVMRGREKEMATSKRRRSAANSINVFDS